MWLDSGDWCWAGVVRAERVWSREGPETWFEGPPNVEDGSFAKVRCGPMQARCCSGRQETARRLESALVSVSDADGGGHDAILYLRLL